MPSFGNLSFELYRVKGVSCAIVTFTVGGLSIVNAVGGAYSDDLPLILISGGPNSNDFASDRILHHTIGLLDVRNSGKKALNFHIEEAKDFAGALC